MGTQVPLTAHEVLKAPPSCSRGQGLLPLQGQALVYHVDTHGAHPLIY